MKLSKIIERLEFINEKRWDIDFKSMQIQNQYAEFEEQERVIYQSDSNNWWKCLMITDDLPF